MYTTVITIDFSIVNIVASAWISNMTFMIKAEVVPAIPADSFVDSIGVNTHWAYHNVYTYNYTGLKAKLAESGIRYLRDGTYPETFIRATDLYHSLGIKTILIGYKHAQELYLFTLRKSKSG